MWPTVCNSLFHYLKSIWTSRIEQYLMKTMWHNNTNRILFQNLIEPIVRLQIKFDRRGAFFYPLKFQFQLSWEPSLNATWDSRSALASDGTRR